LGSSSGVATLDSKLTKLAFAEVQDWLASLRSADDVRSGLSFSFERNVSCLKLIIGYVVSALLDVHEVLISSADIFHDFGQRLQ
jgi:hypothetical protein